MAAPHTPVPPKPSALWLWGLWVYFGAACAAVVASGYVTTPADRLLLGAGGVLCLLAGVHGRRVEAYKRAARGPYTVWGFDSYVAQRQTAWSAMILGALLIASAWFGFVGR